MALIEIAHLTKLFSPARTFGDWLRAPLRRSAPVVALDDVSLTIEAGELVCLMGSNGAGKTTLLKILAGLLLPAHGTIRIHGVDQRANRMRLAAQVGFGTAELPGFYDRLTGRQNLEFFATLYGLSSSVMKRRIWEVGELLEMTSLDQRYQEYSSGAKQRVLLARVLLHDPSILLLDEPTKSLDPLQTERVHALLQGPLRRMGKTILLATHQVWEAEALGGRIALLRRGVIRACATADQLKSGGSLQTAIKQLCGPG